MLFKNSNENKPVMDELAAETTVPLIFQSIVELVLGVFLVLYRDKTSDILFIVTGALMIGYGVFDLIAFLTNNRPYSFRQGLASGVLTIIIGIAFIVQARTLSNLVGIVLGAIIVLESIVNCRRVFIMKRYGFEKWYIPFIISVLILILGAFICVFPDIFFEAVFIIMGISVILVGLIDLWSMLTLISIRRKLEKQAKNENGGNSIIINEDKNNII